MPTPRDFVKQDSTLTMQQHCESFLDTLAAKGATDTVFLFKELLETFPVSRATAILILWDWQENRAPSTQQCRHGQLARQCGYCEQAAETARLVLELNGLYALVRNVRTDLDVVMTVLEKVNHASEEELAHQRGFLARLDAALAAKGE